MQNRNELHPNAFLFIALHILFNHTQLNLDLK